MTTTAIPSKPWEKSNKDRAREFSFIIFAIAFSYAFVGVTEMKGKLAYAFMFFVAYAVLVSGFGFLTRGAPAAKDAFVKTLVALGSVLTLIPIASIILTVVRNGLPGLKLNLFTQDMSLAAPTDPLTNGGLLHAITGTLTCTRTTIRCSLKRAKATT